MQLFKSLIAVLKCNSERAVKTDFIIRSELKTEWKKTPNSSTESRKWAEVVKGNTLLL